MANLNQIQQLLNTSADYLNHFLLDPVAALAQQGLHLSLDMQQDIRQQVRQASAAKKGGKDGSKLKFLKVKINVVIIASVIRAE
jgi:hypothetical protein